MLAEFREQCIVHADALSGTLSQQYPEVEVPHVIGALNFLSSFPQSERLTNHFSNVKYSVTGKHLLLNNPYSGDY
jgi:hypothetical protein